MSWPAWRLGWTDRLVTSVEPRTACDIACHTADMTRGWGPRFDEKGNPSHLPDGTVLDAKAASKAAKEAEKLRKQRAPLEKRMVDDPCFLVKLRQEVNDLSADMNNAG